MSMPEPVSAVVDHEAGTVTVAVTFDWDRSRLSLDACEVAGFLASVRAALLDRLLTTEWGAPAGPVTGFAYQCFEPDEERELGHVSDYSSTTCTGCGQPARMIDDAPWFEHVGPSGCRTFLDDVGDEAGHVVRFANALEARLPAPA